MSPLRAVSRALLWLYPRDFRDRYGGELDDLVDEIGPRPVDLIDLAIHAFAARHRAVRASGGPSMSSPAPNRASRLFAVAALFLASWTWAFVAFNVLRYNVGLAIGDGAAWGFAPSSPIPATIGVLGDVLFRLALAAVGTARVSRLGADAAGPRFVVRVRPTRLTMVAAVACGLAVAVVLGYVVSENVLEALR